MNRALLPCCVLLLLAGFGSASGAGGVGSVSLQIQVVAYASAGAPPLTTGSFSLTCAPPGGTLPFAPRICDDIARHPLPMLDPYGAPGCPSGGPFISGPLEAVSVSGTAGGKRVDFEIRVEPTTPCLGTGAREAARIYFAAAKGDQKPLGDLERGLQCQEDFFPTLNGVRGESYTACIAGLYTPRIDRLIRIAKRAPSLASIGAARSFPIHIGAQLCKISAVRPGYPEGLCTISIEHPWGDPTITFELTWVNGLGNGQTGSALRHHTWRVVLRKDRVVSVTQSGPPPPQLRR